MLKCCTCFSVQNISNNDFQIQSPLQYISLVLGKRIFKTMHCYKKCLTDALFLAFKIFLTMALNTFPITLFMSCSPPNDC